MRRLATPEALAAQVAEAVADELITGYRRHQVPRAEVGDICEIFWTSCASGNVRIDIGGDVIQGQDVATRSSAIAKGGIAISGTVLGHVIQVYQTPPGKGKLSDKDVERILGEYLRWVGDAYDKARLFGMESAPVTKPASMQRLTDVFIPLTLRRFSPPGRREKEEALAGKTGVDALLAWRRLSQAEERTGDIVDLADLLTLSDRLAIVGGAGCGKSTVLAYLAATLARAAQTGDALPYRLPHDRPLVPILVPLRYYRDYLDKCRHAAGRELDDPRVGTLAGYLPWYLRRRSPVLELSEDFFDRILMGGGCLLMIDGLDEIANRNQRGQVRQEVENLVRDIYPGNRVIVTAREAGYREEAVFGDDFTRLDVQDLDEQQIATLVDNWCRRLYPEDVVGSRDKLVGAIGDINELRRERDLPSLVSTPLLVTMVVSVQWGETELPRERARLYEACVKAIIQAQYIPDDPARQALVDWGGPWEAQRDWLSELALAMHEGGRAGAAVREEQVRSILQGYPVARFAGHLLAGRALSRRVVRGAGRVLPVHPPDLPGVSRGAPARQTARAVASYVAAASAWTAGGARFCC